MIKINNLKYKYDNKSDFELTIEKLEFQKGKFISLIGSNGSGKTTFLKICSGIIPVSNSSEGSEIKINDKIISDYSKNELAKKVVFVPSEFRTEFDISGFEYVCLGRIPYMKPFSGYSKEDSKIVEAAMEITDCLSFKNRKTLELSSGEKQRLLLAKAIAQEANCLLLDEISANQDIEHKNIFYKKISQIAHDSNKLIISSTHDVHFSALYSDEIIKSEKGKIVKLDKSNKIVFDNISIEIQNNEQINAIGGKKIIFSL